MSFQDPHCAACHRYCATLKDERPVFKKKNSQTCAYEDILPTQSFDRPGKRAPPLRATAWSEVDDLDLTAPDPVTTRRRWASDSPTTSSGEFLAPLAARRSAPPLWAACTEDGGWACGATLARVAGHRPRMTSLESHRAVCPPPGEQVLIWRERTGGRSA